MLRSALKSILAQQSGDALTSGSAAYTQGSGAKWSQPEYNAAINFAIDLLRDMFLIPLHTVTTANFINASIYELTPPSGMVYVYEIIKDTSAANSLYEKLIPLDIVTVRRDAGGPVVHLDKDSVENLSLNASGSSILWKGYQYQTNASLTDASEISLPPAAIMLTAKIFLHQSGATRDPAELLKNMRQIEQARVLSQELAQGIGTIPVDGGIWLTDM